MFQFSGLSKFHMPSLLSSREDEIPLLSEESSQQTPCLGFRKHARLVHLARQCGAFMKPSFLRKRQDDTAPEKPAPGSKKYSTEYLDGVRGVASLIVFNSHWIVHTYRNMDTGWGYQDNTSFWLLPFIRLIYSGPAMVSVFFVVSGFVLSHRFIQRMHRFEHDNIYSALTSITFRRFIRLFLPAFVSSVLAYVCASSGMVDTSETVSGQPFVHSFSAFLEFLDLESNPWTWDFNFSGFYNPQLWSIAVEFRGSLVVFLLVLALAKTRALVRIGVQVLLIIHSFGFGHKRWDIALFIAGMTIAELEVLLRKPKSLWKRIIVDTLLVVTFIFGLFLSGYPKEHSTETAGYMWTANLWPYTAYRRRYWLAIGAILIVGPIAFLPSVQSVFLTRPVRYLGRISFALYLVHSLTNQTVGLWLLNLAFGVFGSEDYWPRTISFVIATVLYLPFVIWVSDMFWRGIDMPSMVFARWFEKKCTVC